MPSRLLMIACPLLLVAVLVAGADAGEIPAGYDRGVRPDLESGSIQVEIGLYV